LRRVDTAAVDLDHIQYVVAGAEYDHKHKLLVSVTDHGAHDVSGVFRTVDRLGCSRWNERPFSQGESGLDAGSSAFTDAIDIGDFGGVRPVQAMDIPELSQESLGDLKLLGTANNSGQ